MGYSKFDNYSFFATAYYWFMTSPLNIESALNKENSGVNTRSDKTYDINLGASYFNKYKFINYELLSGIGFGGVNYDSKTDLYIDNYIFNMNANKINLFIQPNIGYKMDDGFEIGLFAKLLYSHYFNLQSYTELGAARGIETNDKYFYKKNNVPLFIAEPGLVISVGDEEIKYFTQVSQSINLRSKGFHYRETNITLGFVFYFTH